MRHRESDLQIACVTWFRLQFPSLALLLFAVPNGGARDAREGARLKREGVTAGVADLILLHPNASYHALCIEMKTTDKDSRQRPTQKAWQQAAESVGNKYVVVRSFDDFRREIVQYFS